MHYLSTYSESSWVRWGGAVVGEAIASPFVEVVCIAGVVLYARSENFRTRSPLFGLRRMARW
jgi:hypothetical protein